MSSWAAFLLLTLPALVTSLAQVRLGDTMLHGLPIPTFKQEFFGGIPFAEPPLGPLRFASPALKLDPGVPELNVTQYGIACLQGLGVGQIIQPFNSSAMSEDCLKVNIFRPAGVNDSSALPVMVWVYGGGFLDGEASIYNGSAIVAQSVLRGTPIIYVNLNYRLGAVGFPQGVEAEARGATNLGDRDVLAALTWVQRNIGAFGGDKDKVTAFGQSAGAMILSQLLLNKTFNLARAVILESGSAATHTILPASARESAWQTFVSGVPECSGAPKNNTFDCLRSANTETIFNATNFALSRANELFPFSPNIDGPGGVIPELPTKVFARGEFAQIPFISGTVKDEGTRFVPTSVNSTEQLQRMFFDNLTNPDCSTRKREAVLGKLLELYPDNPTLGSPFGTGNNTFGLDPQFKRGAALLGDVAFVALRRQVSQVASRSGVKVFSYLFTDPQTSSSQAFFGVPHTSEVPYVYGDPPNGPASLTLSQTMIDYWLSFAVTLDPNDGRGNSSRPVWTQYTPASENIMELNSQNLSMIADGFRETRMAFANAHPTVLLH